MNIRNVVATWKNFDTARRPHNQRLQLTGSARDMMQLSVWSLLSAGGRQLSLSR